MAPVRLGHTLGQHGKVRMVEVRYVFQRDGNRNAPSSARFLNHLHLLKNSKLYIVYKHFFRNPTSFLYPFCICWLSCLAAIFISAYANGKVSSTVVSPFHEKFEG